MATVPKKPTLKKPKRKAASEQSVLAMTPRQACAFFLKPESYCRVEFPPYLDFGRVLSPVKTFLDSKLLSSASSKPRDHEGVNYTIYSNKDGRYRPIR